MGMHISIRLQQKTSLIEGKTFKHFYKIFKKKLNRTPVMVNNVCGNIEF
jgi:hypothetical protein